MSNERLATGQGWREGVLSEVLKAPAVPANDLALGAGIMFEIGEGERQKRLEVFPATSALRLRTPDTQIEMFRLAEPRPGAAVVIFETAGSAEGLRLSVSAQGEVILFRGSGG